MRVAAVIVTSFLIAGCSQPATKQSEHTQTPPGSAPGASPTPTAPASAPAAGAQISQVVAWIEAGRPADPARYHSATRDGVVTPLPDDVAFTATAGKASCTTGTKHTPGALVCLVGLTAPPPRPETAYGDWKGGWVVFDGTSLQVGASRGDPGPFVNGDGPELAGGDTLSFGDFRCRADQAGLFCVNYAHQSAVRFAPAGVQPFGCLRPVPAPDGVGTAFGC